MVLSRDTICRLCRDSRKSRRAVSIVADVDFCPNWDAPENGMPVSG